MKCCFFLFCCLANKKKMQVELLLYLCRDMVCGGWWYTLKFIIFLGLKKSMGIQDCQLLKGYIFFLNLTENTDKIIYPKDR